MLLTHLMGSKYSQLIYEAANVFIRTLALLVLMTIVLFWTNLNNLQRRILLTTVGWNSLKLQLRAHLNNSLGRNIGGNYLEDKALNIFA